MVDKSSTLPAPLARADLDAVLRPFGPSRMLPRAAYVDDEVLAWEQRHFFAGGWTCVGRSEDLLDGHSRGTMVAGLDERQRRQVLYLAVFPNLLVSLHPDYVMTHRLTPLAVDRTGIECVWSFPIEAIQRPGFDPSYAVDFWDVTNRQDWLACESVQRGVANPGTLPGPLASEEDGVYQFETMVARRYLAPDQARNVSQV